MKQWIIFIASTVIFITVFAFPYECSYSIDKGTINSIKPVAGIIANDNESYSVGTELACTFWLEKESLPDVATYVITKPFALGWLGFEYKVEIIPIN